MSKLEDLQPNAAVRGVLPDALVSVVSVQWFGSEAIELTYKTAAGKVANELLYRHDEARLELVERGRPWSFDGDGALFRLVSEAQRIRIAHLFDPVLAVHTSVVDPLPHQITAVYEAMLPRQPLRFLLADDPGAGKTIMAGLLIKEIIARGDLQRCLVVCPGSLAEQWQDELFRRFHLPFEILTNDKLEAARTGNWFVEANLVIAQLDKLSRNEDVQLKLQAPDCRWDLVVCDEAHKLEEARTALGVQVFDVLGKLQFEGKSLRDLLIEAIRYGETEAVRTRLTTVVENALDRGQLQNLLDDHALAHDAMDASRVQKIREDMERAEARRLQPHYIESFFHEAFQRLGGTSKQREPRRHEITHVPALVRSRDRLIGFGEPVLARYERIAFEKSLVFPQGQPLAAFVCPGHPLPDSVLDVTLERHRDLLERGAVLVDERDLGVRPRVLFYLEHAIQDASLTRSGERRVVSKRVMHVELDADGSTLHVHYAPYLGYRPLAEGEPGVDVTLERPECAWINRELEAKAQGYAVAQVVPEHLKEVRDGKLELLAKTEAAVKDRLTKEITYWDHRAEQLKLPIAAGADTQASAARARAISMEIERGLGFEPTDRELEKLGYDIESRVVGTGKLRFIEVKGRISGAATITVTRKEISYSLNKPEDFILAIVEFTGDNTHRVHHLRQPFAREPDFGVTSVNYDFSELIARAEQPN